MTGFVSIAQTIRILADFYGYRTRHKEIIMNLSNKDGNNTKSVVVDFQNYVGCKTRLKKRCAGCSYRFTPKNNHDCFCNQCSDGVNVYRRLKATQAMLAVGDVYGYH